MPFFPEAADENVRLPANQAARVEYGDAGVKKRISEDVAAEARRRQHSDHNN